MPAGTKGSIVQVIGTVVDIEFPPGELPGVYNAVEIDKNGTMMIAEVQQHLGNNWVRALTMADTDGLRRGASVTDTGAPLTVPVGPETLGRLFDVLGNALDNMGPLARRSAGASATLVFPSYGGFYIPCEVLRSVVQVRRGEQGSEYVFRSAILFDPVPPEQEATFHEFLGIQIERLEKARAEAGEGGAER